MLNLVSVFEHRAKETPDKKAIIFGDQSFSFAQVEAMVNKVANGLISKGIQKGDKVASSMKAMARKLQPMLSFNREHP